MSTQTVQGYGGKKVVHSGSSIVNPRHTGECHVLHSLPMLQAERWSFTSQMRSPRTADMVYNLTAAKVFEVKMSCFQTSQNSNGLEFCRTGFGCAFPQYETWNDPDIWLVAFSKIPESPFHQRGIGKSKSQSGITRTQHSDTIVACSRHHLFIIEACNGSEHHQHHRCLHIMVPHSSGVSIRDIARLGVHTMLLIDNTECVNDGDSQRSLNDSISNVIRRGLTVICNGNEFFECDADIMNPMIASATPS